MPVVNHTKSFGSSPVPCTLRKPAFSLLGAVRKGNIDQCGDRVPGEQATDVTGKPGPARALKAVSSVIITSQGPLQTLNMLAWFSVHDPLWEKPIISLFLRLKDLSDIKP